MILLCQKTKIISPWEKMITLRELLAKMAISSEEREEGEIPDKLITEGMTRFDPLEDSSDDKLDKSKANYAKKYCKLHFTEDKIQKTIFDSAPMPANYFLTPPEVDDYGIYLTFLVIKDL